ncbi:MAG: hypothetical protein Q7R40_17085 [Phaeospirillum sp.]|nr:hypothetical protein [Phaeospirillum sp.]
MRSPPKRVGVDGVTLNLKDNPEAYYRYLELAGNGVKLPQYDGLGAKDFLDKVVTGKSPWSEVYRIRSDGPDGRKSEFIRKVIQDYRAAARTQLLDEFPKLRAEYEDGRAHRTELKLPIQ